MIDRFNVRVYAACIKNNKLLVLREEYAGGSLAKFPGGGLEFGEGALDCLKRELLEELNLKITKTEHLYTQEDFLISRFSDKEQLLTLYYTVDVEEINDLVILDPCIESLEWISLKEENPFELPVDKIVFDKLKEKYVNAPL
ncbi:MAG: NUDIX domain-containing protein [Bergeyella sp.]|nr:NUDIX domain-containing protein [Bergeyella sp.]